MLQIIFRLLLGHCLAGGEENRLRGVEMYHFFWLEAVEEGEEEEEEDAPEECRSVKAHFRNRTHVDLHP